MDVSLVIVAVTIISILLVLCLVDLTWKKFFLMKHAKNIPIMPYLPLVGSAHLLLTRDVSTFIQEVVSCMKSSGYFWLFNTPYFLAFDPEILKVVLTDPGSSKKGYFYNFMRPVLRNCMIAADDVTWKQTRRSIVKAFGQKQLENFVTTFDNMTEVLMEQLEQNKTCTAMYLTEINERFLLDSFIKTLCDIHLEHVSFDISRYLEVDIHYMIKCVTNGFVTRFLRPWLYPDIIYFNTPEGKQCNDVQKRLDDTFLNIIAEKRADSIERKKGYLHSKSSSVVDILIKDNRGEDDILGELKFLAVAASETTAIALTFALNLLGCYPDIQEKVFQEVSDVLGKQQSVEQSHILQMKYTEMVMLETMRLFPPIPLVIREATEDIDIGGAIIPKYTQIPISIAALHRNESIWPNPLEFRPERFSPEEVIKRSDYSFLPFSAGPKYCLGTKYAITVFKMALAKIIRKYKIESSMKSAADVELKSFITLFPPEDILCTLSEREI